jgi:RNA polymerase sigma factor (sigma-70 family)
MPKGDIVQTLLEVKDINPTTKVLVLTAFSEDENIFNAAKGGARGYVLKGIDFTTLLRAIKTVQGGGLWVDKDLPAAEAFEEIAQDQLNDFADVRSETRENNEALKALTRREVEILRLVAEGLTNEEIGKKIFISEKTVKTHLTNIFDKLKVNNRFKAALLIMGRSGDAALSSSTRSIKSP